MRLLGYLAKLSGRLPMSTSHVTPAAVFMPAFTSAMLFRPMFERDLVMEPPMEISCLPTIPSPMPFELPERSSSLKLPLCLLLGACLASTLATAKASASVSILPSASSARPESAPSSEGPSVELDGAVTGSLASNAQSRDECVWPISFAKALPSLRVPFGLPGGETPQDRSAGSEEVRDTSSSPRPSAACRSMAQQRAKPNDSKKESIPATTVRAHA
eukprot:CAMPEP_0183414482 /NCGR_PEP_ID=MMETSP0370-20130417/22420_1 /TAXON_ID=268820 /ORGANISM="Peridinium aciculiferum, Strain PAER-2" /LENGTH=216 /DNA_ID=CAMNT_0025597807 /DNA_START=65 /DNA_END=711 /DNA_ORIENTATION=+